MQRIKVWAPKCPLYLHLKCEHPVYTEKNLLLDFYSKIQSS